MKLYAIWKKQKMTTLTFKDSLPGGASDIPNPITIVPSMSSNVQIPSAIPRKGGRQFTGWNTKKDGSGSRYAPGSTITLKADRTLWAQWVKAEDSWFVIYDANGGTKAPKPQIVKRGKDATLSKEHAKAGKMIFKGWTTNPKKPKVEYKPGDVLPYDSRKNVVVLYAVWNLSPVPQPVHVTFDANGLARADLPEDVWLEQGGWLQLSAAIAPLGSGYSFLGWSEKSSSKEPEYLAGRSYPFDRNTKLYAVWKKVVAPDYTLLARMTVSHCDSKALEIEWTKVQSVEGYDVFFARCGSNFKLKQTVSANTRHLRVSSLDKRTCYKAYVKAWKTVNGKKVYIGKASPEVHAITGGYNSKYCNARSVKLDKSSLTMEAGNSKTLKATVKKVKSNKELLNHTAKVRYYSSDPNVAAVDENGKITAVEAGKCRIWAIATNGMRASVSVTVK